MGKKIRTFSLTAEALWTLGILFLIAGLFGTLTQARILNTGILSNAELFDAIQADSGLMTSVTFALAGQTLETCAVPIFVFLLVENTAHTSNFGKYFLQVLVMAIVSQLPYNLLMAGNLLKFNGLNPAFAAVMSLIMLYFLQRFSNRTAGNIVIQCFAVLFAFLWSNILGIPQSAPFVIISTVLWKFRGKQNLQTLFGLFATLSCAVFSMFYMVAPISFLILHFHDGARGNYNRIFNYATYPAMLLIFGLLLALC